MKRFHILLISIVLGVFVFSCDSEKKSEKEFEIEISGPDKKFRKGDSLTLQIDSKGEKIDSVQYFYEEKPIGNSEGNKKVSAELQSPLGNRFVSAVVFQKGKKHHINKKIVLHTDKAPTVYSYNIIKTYPHDVRAFTQGLEFHNDTLYEGTGQYGISSLRKVDYKTGKVLKEIKLKREYFGEGITIMNDKIYQLTWQENTGLIYDLKTLEQIDTFEYDESPEGWGLCNDGKQIYKSDGTERIWILDPETLEEIDYFEPVTNNAMANRVNEMEFVNGKIYANTWMKEGVLIIDPQTGAVEGLIDFRGLKDKIGNKNRADVFNGIAYHPQTGHLFVTGKNWDTMFEVEIVKK